MMSKIKKKELELKKLKQKEAQEAAKELKKKIAKDSTLTKNVSDVELKRREEKIGNLVQNLKTYEEVKGSYSRTKLKELKKQIEEGQKYVKNYILPDVKEVQKEYAGGTKGRRLKNQINRLEEISGVKVERKKAEAAEAERKKEQIKQRTGELGEKYAEEVKWKAELRELGKKYEEAGTRKEKEKALKELKKHQKRSPEYEKGLKELKEKQRKATSSKNKKKFGKKIEEYKGKGPTAQRQALKEVSEEAQQGMKMFRGPKQTMEGVNKQVERLQGRMAHLKEEASKGNISTAKYNRERNNLVGQIKKVRKSASGPAKRGKTPKWVKTEEKETKRRKKDSDIKRELFSMGAGHKGIKSTREELKKGKELERKIRERQEQGGAGKGAKPPFPARVGGFFHRVWRKIRGK